MMRDSRSAAGRLLMPVSSLATAGSSAAAANVRHSPIMVTISVRFMVVLNIIVVSKLMAAW